MLTVVSDSADRDGSASPAPGSSSVIDELVRAGARRMLAEALQAEVDAYIARFAEDRDENGRRLVVRNGRHEPRAVTTCAGVIEVHAPRVNDRRVDPDTGERQRFSSAILPPWARKTPQIEQVLPLLYLHGLSSGDFVPALGQFLGSAQGLSASTITKLTQTWKAEARAFAERDLSTVDYVYLWADGIHVNVRLEEARAVPAGDDRGTRRRPQGTRRADRWLSGGHRVLGGSAARLCPPRDARPGAGVRRRRAGVLGRAAGGVPARPASSAAGSTRYRLTGPRGQGQADGSVE